MKKGVKITLWVVGVLAVLVILFITCADVWTSRYAEKIVRQELEKAQLPVSIDFKHIHVLLMTGCVDVEGIVVESGELKAESQESRVESRKSRVESRKSKVESGELKVESQESRVESGESRGESRKSGRSPRVESQETKVESQKILDTLRVEIPHVVVSNIHYGQLLRKRIVAARRIDVLKMSATTKLSQAKVALNVDSLSISLRHPAYSIKDSALTISKLGVELMNSKIQMAKEKINFEIDSLSVGLHDLFYNVKDTTFGYNDSVYNLNVDRFQVKMAQTMMGIEAKKVFTENGGEITLGQTRIWNTCGRRDLAPKLKEPATWIDLHLNSVVVSPLNPFRTDFSKGVAIHQISVNGDCFEAFRDARLEPTHPYPMPQTVLMQIPLPIKIDAIDAKLKTLDVGVLCSDKNLGKMQIKDVTASICDFSNKRGSTTVINAIAHIGDGKVNGVIKMYMNKAGKFDIEIKGKDINTNELAHMTRPLAAIELNCAIDSMHLKYSADNDRLGGNVLFAYHGLNGKVYGADDIPFKIISKNAGALEYFVNHLIPKSNPRAGLKEPLAYRVEYVRKDMQPVPLYLVMPVILGAVQTYLPGFFVSKKVNKNEL